MTEGERRAATWPWWLGFFAVLGMAARLSYLAYHELLPETLRAYDKVVHFTFAGLLAFFLDGAIRRRALAVAGVAIPVAPIGLLAVFACDEIAQSFTVHRTASFADYAADVAGVVVLTWLSRRAGRLTSSEPGRADARDDRAE